MNDPGLHEPISDSAKHIESRGEDDGEDDGVDEDQAFLEPSRWWFASTASPLLAGTFGPMASAFNVCALASHWRESIPPGGTEASGEDIPDTEWLLVINGASLALALVANLALLLNMTRRISFSVAQPITIIGWYLSAFLLIGLIVAATYAPSFMLAPGEDRALTQAFYYAIYAAALYIIISTLMMVTVYGAYAGHYPKDFKLTISQRTLMLQTISFMVYLLAGAAIYSRIEGWAYLDALYWADFTLLTIGIGNVAPQTNGGRALLFPYAIGGIVILGLVIGSIRSLVLERGKRKISARMEEKKRQSVVKQMNKHDEMAKLTPVPTALNVNHDGKNEKRRREEEFHLMRKIQDHASARRKWTSLLVSATAWLFLWLIGALVFYYTENTQGWSYFQSLYFAYTSLLTLGFGDYYPLSNSGKPFFVFWSLLAVPTLTVLISNMGDTVVKGIRDLTLWLGELTILPGEGQRSDRVKSRLAYLKGVIGSQDEPAEEPPGGIYLSAGNRDPEKAEKKTKQGEDRGNKAAERLAREIETGELEDAEEARRHGDRLGEDRHLYLYLLIKEIRLVMRDRSSSPPKRYSYDDWTWFLKLLGEDEEDGRHHRRPPAEETPDELEEGGLGRGGVGRVGEDVKWSWVGARSPLMGEQDEAEWVIERLTARLEEELRDSRHENRMKDEKGAISEAKSRDEKREPLASNEAAI